MASKAAGSALLAVGLAFFLAELGGKTLLATITLAADHGLLGTWVGSTIGMVLAGAPAIAVGIWLGGQLPDRLVRSGTGRQPRSRSSEGADPRGNHGSM